MTNSGAGMSPKPPADMENQVFQKAKSKEEYLSLVAKLIVYVRESANQKKATMGGAPGPMGGAPGPMGGAPGPMGGAPGPMGGGPVPMGGAPGPMGGPMQGMPPQDPINALQSMTKGPGGQPQGMHPQGPMQQGPMAAGMGPSGPVMGPGGPQMVPGAMQGQPMMQQRAPFQNYQPGPGHRPMGPGMHGQGYGHNVMGQPSMGQPMPPQHPQGMQPQSQFSGGGQNVMPSAMGMRQGAPPAPYQQNMPFSSTGLSPATMASHSPAMLPSPSQSAVAPSPVSSRPMQVTSPASVTLNTPQSGPVPSPADGKTGEEWKYLEKLKKLQKYVEPLKRMINRIEKDNDRKKDFVKMKNLLDILTDPSKRLPMETLSKCQNVLEKLDLEFQKSASTTSTTDTFTLQGSKHGQHMCQSLINRIASQIKQPLFNHTLKRTFGPAVEALHGSPIRAPSPPPKKRRGEEEEEGGGCVSDLLQGEIARLHHKFTVDLDPLYHNQSKSVHLICKLDDKNLPTVPPIAVTVPENYPQTSPLCETDTTGYENTPFLQRVQKSMTSHLLNMPSRFSVTALLNIWEMSVRKATACATPSV